MPHVIAENDHAVAGFDVLAEVLRCGRNDRSENADALLFALLDEEIKCFVDLFAHGVADLETERVCIVDRTEVDSVNARNGENLVDVVGELEVLIHRDHQGVTVLLFNVLVPVEVVVAKARCTDIGFTAASSQRIELGSFDTASCHLCCFAVRDDNTVSAPLENLADRNFIIISHSYKNCDVMKLCGHDLFLECFIQLIVGMFKIEINEVQSALCNVFNDTGCTGEAGHTEYGAFLHLFF